MLFLELTRFRLWRDKSNFKLLIIGEVQAAEKNGGGL